MDVDENNDDINMDVMGADQEYIDYSLFYDEEPAMNDE